MAKPVESKTRWINGISDYIKEGTADQYYFGKGIDHRSDPRSVKLLPKAIKESGSIMEGLPKWGEIVGTDLYVYDESGIIYKRTSAGVWTKIRTVANSHGNGLSHFGEDDFIYYTTDKYIGRYGPISSANPQFTDDYFGSQGGVPLNTNSLWLQKASSMYAYRADTATTSITADLSIEAQIHPLSLPATGESMTIASKWDQNGNKRSYRFDITTESNYFGSGADGALTISSNTTDAPIDSACTGTVGTYTLSATNVGFAAGQVILIHQTQGTGAGAWQKNKIQGYTAGTISLETALNSTYSTGAQVLVMNQYTDITIDAAKTLTSKAWNGTVGGIVALLASGTFTRNGSISANGANGASANGNGSTAITTGGGFRGGIGNASNSGFNCGCGEGINGATGLSGASTRNNNSNGGGGAYSPSFVDTASGGGGGGNGGTGGSITYPGGYVGTAGSMSGNDDLTTMTFGGGGGGGGSDHVYKDRNSGGSGGGMVFLFCKDIAGSGTISANGGTAGNHGPFATLRSSAGGGAGGSVLIKTQTASLGTGLITATGGAAGIGGGAGGAGRIHIDYYTSYTGTTSPTITALQDSSLGIADGYVLRLTLSSNGTAETTFTKPFVPIIDTWQHVAVSFDSATTGDASICQVEFFYNGVSLGMVNSATLTINDNASEFFVGAYKNATVATGFYDGYIDEVRVWSKNATSSDYLMGITQQIITTTPYLNAYYKFNGDLNDATANANNLSGSGSPTYVSDVPYPSPTTRLDIDQTATTTGNTYTTPVAISENATNRKTFVPAKDPQKSIAVLVAAKGTGDWTITVHDAFNNIITSATILNANVAVGYNEFVFSTPWRPLLNANYHFHVTSTVADGTVTTTTASDLETVSFRTYFQFLVTDTAWHPVGKMLQFLVFGNERYIGKYEATLYNPNHITLPAGYKVRCFGYFREYLAIGTTRGDTITAQDSGRVYFWDGIASTYNFFIDVPEGGINALLGSKGKLWVWAGYQGDLLQYIGGDSADQIKRVPKMEDTKYVEVYPGAVSMWRMLVRWGVAGNGDSTDVERGIYTYGSQNIRYQESLSYDYPISTGSISSQVKIGMVKVVNNKMLIGWQDNAAYGVDYVDASNDVQSSGEVVHVIEDSGAMWKEKAAMTITADFKPLLTGESIDIKYKLDRADNWKKLGAVTTAGETKARFTIADEGQRYKEIQYGVDLATNVATSPTLLGIAVETDLLESEKRV